MDPPGGVPAPDTDNFPAIIMMLQGFSLVHAGDFETTITFLSGWIEQGTPLPAMASFPPLVQYTQSLDTATNTLINAMIAHPLPHLPTLLTYVATLHSLYSLRHMIFFTQTGAVEPGVDLVDDTRSNLQPMLRVCHFLSTRARSPEYAAHHESITVFTVTLGITLASVKAMLPHITSFAFYQAVQTMDSVYFLRLVYACLERDVPPVLPPTVAPIALLTNVEMMLPPMRWAKEQLSWIGLLRADGRVSPTHSHLTTVQLAALRSPASLNVEVTVRCWRHGCRASPGLGVKRCGRCKRVYYCGENCRNLDWSAGHSGICKTLANIRSMLDNPDLQESLQTLTLVREAQALRASVMPRAPKAKPSQPELHAEVLRAAKPIDRDSLSTWRASCALHGHFLKDVHLQYLTCDSNLGRRYVKCDIEHNLDNWGKGKGVRFVSDELTLETRRALILYRDGLRLDIDEPQVVGPKKPARKPRQQKGKKKSAMPFADTTSVLQNSLTSTTSRTSKTATPTRRSVNSPASYHNPKAATPARRPLNSPDTLPRGSSDAPISVDSSRAMSFNITDGAAGAGQGSAARDDGFDSQGFQCVWYYKQNGDIPEPIWLPWPRGQASIELSEYLDLWDQHETKTSDKVKILAASKKRRGSAVWKVVVLGDIVLHRRLPGIVIARTSVTDLHSSISGNKEYAFPDTLPVLQGTDIEL
ncbi:unnamed protein product [Peniophora sp. CBMAI 1063]|nr:unnamed protein product [Peniophora sp. CBMAI 1063]